MDDNIPASSTAEPVALASFPSEILQNIFYFATSTTLFQLIRVSRKFFEIASESRELILHHLRHVPGIKLGLDDRSISTSDLFLIFRQRAASHLYGVNFTADCRTLEPSLLSRGVFDPRASYLTTESDSCVVFKNSLCIKLNLHNNATYGETLESPYGDGRAKILQVVQKSYYVSVLYAWEPPPKDPAEDTSHPEPAIPMSVQQVDTHRARPDSRDGLRYRVQRGGPRLSSTSPRVRYHLLHYDLFRSDRPIFFPIPTHKSLRGVSLAPVHLAVHNRLQCAILWDLPETVLPTPNATVCLYKAEHLPRYEPGSYDVWVIYPFDHPAPYRRPDAPTGSIGSVMTGSESDDEAGPNSARMVYTHTKVSQPIGGSGRRYRDYESDLRFLHFPLKPRSISFFKEGRRLSLYAPDSITPFTTLLANEAIRSRLHPSASSQFYHTGSTGTSWPRSSRRVRGTNHTSIRGHHFTLSLPFFSKHETISRPTPQNPDADEDDIVVENECLTNMLCIGTARIPSIHGPTTGSGITELGPEVFAIVQIRVRKPYDDCLHSGKMDDLPSGLPRPPIELRRRRTPANPNSGQESDFNVLHAPYTPVEDGYNSNNEDGVPSEPEVEFISDSDTDDTGYGALDGIEIRVAARLWGCNASSTSLTGLETVSISPRGERIAVAQWDKILVYALNPSALCEEPWKNCNDSDDDSSDGGSNSDNDSDSDNNTENEDAAASTTSIVEDAIGTGDPAGTTLIGGSNDIADGSPQPPASPSGPSPPPASVVPPGPSSAAPNPPASIASIRSTSLSHLVNYYPHINDKNLGGSTVLLRPILLKMDAGAVVRKMSWDLCRPVRVDENKNSSDEEEDELEDPASKGQGNESADEKAANMNNKDDNAEEIERAGVGDSRPPPSQGAASESTQDRGGPSANVNMIDSQELPETTSSPAPISSVDVIPESPPVESIGLPTSHTSKELPPAPFSDVKLTGQIRHIDRPPEYNHFPFTITIDPEMSLSPTGSEVDVDMDKVEESIADVDDSAVRSEPEKTTVPDIEHTGTSAPEQSTPQIEIKTVQAEPELLEPEAKPQRRRKRKPRKRVAENELVVMTDRGIQIWDLSVWGTGKRVREDLPCGDILQ